MDVDHLDKQASRHQRPALRARQPPAPRLPPAPKRPVHFNPSLDVAPAYSPYACPPRAASLSRTPPPGSDTEASVAPARPAPVSKTFPPGDLGTDPGIGFRHLWPQQATHPHKFSDLPDPRRQATVAQNTVPFRFTGKSPGINERHAACFDFRKQLYAAGCDPNNGVDIKFPPEENRASFLDLTYRQYTAYERAKSAKLYWQGKPLKFHSAGAFLDPDHWLVNFSGLPDNISLNKFLAAVRSHFQHDFVPQDMYLNFSVTPMALGGFLAMSPSWSGCEAWSNESRGFPGSLTSMATR